MNKLSIIHVIDCLHPRSGGPSRTVVQLTDALSTNSELDVTLLSQGLTGEPSVPSADRVSRCMNESSSRYALKFGLPVLIELKRLTRYQVPALIHSHGLWAPVNHWASVAARRNKIPLIIHPRGMLEPWALNHKGMKKRFAMALYQRRDLTIANLLVATSNVEFESIRELGLRQPVAIIPNGVVLDVGAEPVQYRPMNRTRVALFLSRVHPVKGLLNLVHAWARVAPVGWRLCIAGPDEAGHLREVLALVRQLGVQDSIEYVGGVDDEVKSDLYNAADVFVLPTFTENFGLVVAEALAHGLPVITTRGAPWADLATNGCGWWVDIGVEPLVDALREAVALSDEERQAMGKRGRDYVRRFDWADIASQTVDVYKWILGQAPKPDCVRLD